MSRFIVFEGMNGSGKSTLAKNVATAIREKHGKAVLELAFPTAEAPIGKLIREILAGTTRVSLSAMLPLFAAEAADWGKTIMTALDEEKFVISDRYTPISARVYQLDTYTMTDIDGLYASMSLTILQPDATFIVDVPPLVALHRRLQRGTPQQALYEPSKLEGLERERQGYLNLLEHLPRSGGIYAEKLDGQRSPTELVEDVLKSIEEWLD